jgi:large subunit ribosomal protein L9
MEVILLERIAGLGGLGDRVDVKPGYARNYLVPQGKALSATERNITRFKDRRAELERQAADEIVRAQRRSEDLAALDVVITRRAGGEGRLFGSVGIVDVAEAATEAGVEVRRNEVRMPDGPIRQTGRYEVSIRVHPDVEAAVRVAVVPMGGSVEDLDRPADESDESDEPGETGETVELAQSGESGAGEAHEESGTDESGPAGVEDGEDGEEAAE